MPKQLPREQILKLGLEARRAQLGVRDGDGRRLRFCGKLAELAHAGVGIQVYFWDLRLSVMIFVVLSIMAYLPASVLGIVPDSFQQSLDTDAAVKATDSIGLALFSLIIDNGLSAERQVVMLIATAWMALALRSSQERRAQASDESVNTTTDYALEITNVPKTASAGAAALAVHLRDHFGEIDHVELGLSSSRVVELRHRWDQLKVVLDDRDARGQGGHMSRVLRRKVAKLEAQLAEAQVHAQPTGMAFVVFRSQHDASACERAHNRRCWKVAPRFQRSRLRVRPAPDPTDVLWANLEVSKCTKLLLRLPTGVAVVCVIGLTVLVEVLLDTFEPLNEFIVSVMSGAVLFFAALFGYVDTLTQLAASDPTAALIARGQAVSLFTGLVVTAVNWLLESVIERLARAEKANTRTAHERSLFVKLALAFTLNTSVAALISTAPSEWFDVQGAFQRLFWTAVTEVFIGTTLRSLQLGALVTRTIKVCRARSIATVTQAYKPTLWSLGSNYAEASRLVVHCLAFGPVMPMLYPIAALGLAYHYAVSKKLLLLNQKPAAVVGPAIARSYYTSILAGLMLQVGVQLAMDLLAVRPPFQSSLFGLGASGEERVLVAIVVLAALLALNSPLFETTLRTLLPCLFCRGCRRRKEEAELAFTQIKKPIRYRCPANDTVPTYVPPSEEEQRQRKLQQQELRRQELARQQELAREQEKVAAQKRNVVQRMMPARLGSRARGMASSKRKGSSAVAAAADARARDSDPLSTEGVRFIVTHGDGGGPASARSEDGMSDSDFDDSDVCSELSDPNRGTADDTDLDAAIAESLAYAQMKRALDNAKAGGAATQSAPVTAEPKASLDAPPGVVRALGAQGSGRWDGRGIASATKAPAAADAAEAGAEELMEAGNARPANAPEPAPADAPAVASELSV